MVYWPSQLSVKVISVWGWRPDRCVLHRSHSIRKFC